MLAIQFCSVTILLMYEVEGARNQWVSETNALMSSSTNNITFYSME